MWTVLLVEDEVFVRESVREIIDWKRLGFEVIGEAGNGKEAFDFIEQKEPDLVISDILMPIMNGVELLEKVKAKGRKSSFIMLSCLNDFEYVRKAMELGASNYILKLSMDVQSLRETLNKIKIDLIKKEAAHRKEFEHSYLMIWNKIINHRTTSTNDQGLLSRFTIFENLNVTIFTILHGQDFLSEQAFWDLNIVAYDKNAILHFFDISGHTTVFYWSDKKQLEISLNEQYPNKVIVYSQMSNLNNFIQTWEQTLNTLDQYWYDNFEMSKSKSMNYKILYGKEQGIIDALEDLNKKMYKRLIENMWDLIYSHKLSMSACKKLISKLDEGLRRKINQYIVDDLHYDSFIDFHSFKEYGTRQFLHYFAIREKELGIYSKHNEVNHILKYIHQNYSEEITVKSLAKYVAMDENYLSNLFKKEMGDTLIRYLHRVRIDKAKHFLIETDFSIGEIAERVGFMNNNYFIKIFRRFTDKTPGNYRETHQISQRKL